MKFRRNRLPKAPGSVKFNALVEHYCVNDKMSLQEIFDAFVAVENASRPEFDRRRQEAKTESKRAYWAQRASSLTTHGGRTRLHRLLMLTIPKPYNFPTIQKEPIS